MEKIVIAEDDYLISLFFKEILIENGYKDVELVKTGEEAVKAAKKHKNLIILMDISMEYKTSGIDACNKIKKQNPGIKIFFLSAFPKDSFKDQLDQIDYDGYFDKTNFENEYKKILSNNI